MNLFHLDDGNVLIESALILPVIVLMLLLVLDFASILNQDLRVADSARSAAESATVRAYANNLSYVMQVGNASASGIPGYNITAVNYCTCANGASTFTCSSYTTCASYGLPNRYVKVTATASLPFLFGVAGFSSAIHVQSVAIARIAWTGIP